MSTVALSLGCVHYLVGTKGGIELLIARPKRMEGRETSFPRLAMQRDIKVYYETTTNGGKR